MLHAGGGSHLYPVFTYFCIDSEHCFSLKRKFTLLQATQVASSEFRFNAGQAGKARGILTESRPQGNENLPRLRAVRSGQLIGAAETALIIEHFLAHLPKLAAFARHHEIRMAQRLLLRQHVGGGVPANGTPGAR